MERSAHAHGTKRTYRLNDTFRATVLTTAKDTDTAGTTSQTV